MRKAQIEITNIMFMHMIGLVGILTFSFLFVSLIIGSSARAEGLSDETVFYNFGRRLISTSDCLAYNHIETYYNGNEFESYSRTMPGVIDVSKLFDYNHQNCLRYDFVSGSAHADPDGPSVGYPVILYEVYVEDLINDNLYNFTNDVYVSTSTGAELFTICNPKIIDEEGNCLPSDCLFDCDEITAYWRTGIIGDSLKCAVDGIPTQAIDKTNCVYRYESDVTRMVQSYNGTINCSSLNTVLTSDANNVLGKVSQVDLQYAVTLKYIQSYNNTIEHPGILNVRFCEVNIPTQCDSFFSNDNFGFYSQEVYNPDYCTERGLPLI